eukprot:SAG22_NODE_244_length_14023_cov_45.200661_9_plen_496_part_00
MGGTGANTHSRRGSPGRAQPVGPVLAGGRRRQRRRPRTPGPAEKLFRRRQQGRHNVRAGLYLYTSMTRTANPNAPPDAGKPRAQCHRRSRRPAAANAGSRPPPALAACRGLEMADAAPPRQAEQIPLGADGNPLPKNADGLYLDPATGEGMSKNALKKFCKAQEKAAKDAAKKAAKGAAGGGGGAGGGGKKKKGGGAEEEELDPTKYRENRIAAMNKMEAAAAGTDTTKTPYPHKFQVGITFPEFTAKYESLKDGESAPDTVATAGRVMTIRYAGKLTFLDMHSDGYKLQVMAQADVLTGGPLPFHAMNSTIRRGDIVGITGTPARSKRGELSIHPSAMQLLSPCLHMLPKAEITKKDGSKEGGLKDGETRFRQRYLDLIVNDEVRQIFYTRSKITNYIRRFLDSVRAAVPCCGGLCCCGLCCGPPRAVGLPGTRAAVGCRGLPPSRPPPPPPTHRTPAPQLLHPLPGPVSCGAASSLTRASCGRLACPGRFSCQ